MVKCDIRLKDVQGVIKLECIGVIDMERKKIIKYSIYGVCAIMLYIVLIELVAYSSVQGNGCLKYGIAGVVVNRAMNPLSWGNLSQYATSYCQEWITINHANITKLGLGSNSPLLGNVP